MPPMLSRNIRLALAAMLPLAAAAPRAVRNAPTVPRHVSIIAREYAFTAPTHLPAGLTTFHLINRGKVRHEVQIFRFASTTSAADARHWLSVESMPDSVADASGSVLIAASGDSARYGIEIDLKPGERYALLCEFRDAPNKPKHLHFGMFGLIEVDAAPGPRK
jgi:hypothetical protein